MKLPRGATGFDAPAADPAVELRAFTAVCHHAARASGGTVTGATPAGATPNFHTIDIRHGEQHIAALRHTVLPLVAFARPRREGDVSLAFVDHPDLATAVTDASNLQVLTTEQLHTSLTRADLTDLSPAEHHQIADWEPTTIGELLFNFWD